MFSKVHIYSDACLIGLPNIDSAVRSIVLKKVVRSAIIQQGLCERVRDVEVQLIYLYVIPDSSQIRCNANSWCFIVSFSDAGNHQQ